MAEETQQANAEIKAKNLGIGRYQKHILFCAGAKCCAAEEGEAVWQYLKERLNETGLQTSIYRTLTKCLRICADGPIAVVYPEGIWYKKVTKEVCERIIQEHLKNGQPIEDLIIARNPLAPI